VILAANGLDCALAGEAAENFDGQLGADAAHRDEPLNSALFAIEKPKSAIWSSADLGVMCSEVSAPPRAAR